MKRLIVMALAAMTALFVASPAAAQATRTWVSGVGDDANPCSRTAPCKTFAGAISKTAAGGEINCIDPGGFGAVTITKAMTIKCNDVEAGVLVSGTNGVIVNAATTDKVVLDGLDFEGLGTGLCGVKVLQARDVIVNDSTIRNFTTAGVCVNSTAIARVTVANTQLINDNVGVQVIATGGVGAAAKIFRSTFVGNATAGITVDGANATSNISQIEITGGPRSLTITNGGVVNSYGNNVLNGSSTDAPTPTPLQ